MTQSIVCGGCGAEVPYGRLSCPECGEMLASVAGVGRRHAAVGAASAPDDARAVPDGPSIVVPDGQLATWPDAAVAGMADADAHPDAEADADGGAMVGDAADLDDGLPTAADEPFTATSGGSYAASLAAVRSSVPPPAASPTAPAGAAVSPVASPVSPVASPVAATPPPAPTPGAYVPPVLQPAGPAAPARAWAGHDVAASNGSVPSGPISSTPAGAVAAGAAVTGDGGKSSASDEADAASDTARAAEFVGWLAIAGAALTLVGFLLPWSSTAVIGADGVGYFDRWGIAGPGHLLVLGATVAVLAAAILRARVPLWAGVGMPGIGLGALLIGLVWPYLIGPLSGSLGAMAVALGAAMLVGAGIAAIVVDRHGRGEPGV